jgi:DNA polymerase sigma
VEYAEELFDEAAFYEKFDQEICRFVHEIERKLSSVAKEREILSKC